MRVNSKILSFKGTLNTFKGALNLALLSLLVSACGGGGGSGNGSPAALSDATAPTVLATDPASRSRSVAARTPISVTFSETMDASSLTASTFVVSAGGTPIPGTVSVASNSATFTPSADLDLNTLYTASVTTGVKDRAGNAMAAAYSWQFTPGTRVWSAARSMATDAFAPQTGTDSAGNLILVWQQKEGNHYSIWANRYDAAARQWGLATLLQNDNTGSGYVPQLAVNASGHAVAAWQHYDGSRYHVWANHYDAVVGQWGAVQALTGSGSDAFDPQVAISANGNAIVVWRAPDGPFDDPATTLVAGEYYVSSLWVKYYDAVTKTWEAAATALELDDDKGHDVSAAQVVMDSVGNSVVVWQQFNGTVTSVYATRYTVGAGWAMPGSISTGSAGVAMNPQLAMDGGGNAIAVWQQYDANARYSIWASRYVATTVTWGVPALIENADNGDAFDPRLVVNATGDAWVAWHRHDGTTYNIESNHYTVGSGWSSAALIESNNVGDATHAQIAVNASGDAFAVWEQSDGVRTSVWSNRYNPSLQAWGMATLVEVDDSGDARAPQVNVDSTGNASAAWRQWDGAHWKVLTSRYQ